MKRKVELTGVLDRTVFVIQTEPDAPAGRMVLMAHGFRGNSTGPTRTFVDLERLLVEDGISVLRFDQPGSGNSDGDFLGSSFMTWVGTIVELASRKLAEGYRVALLGQSMGGEATMVASSSAALSGRIPAMILWSPGIHDMAEFPDESYLELPFPDATYVEEAGQRVRADFWYEAEQSGFFAALDAYQGAVHLTFGEHDRFDPENLRGPTMERFRSKGHQVTVLDGQDHSGWDYEVAQQVYERERAFLREHLV